MTMQTPCVDLKEPEDMQDYLARMNKQLEEMAAQHLQTSAPRRESLARATVRYLERKASATDNANTSAAGGPLTSLSAGNSTCRRSSIGEDTPGQTLFCSGAAASNSAELVQQQQAAHASPAAHHAKHRSDAGVYFAGAPHQWSSNGTDEQVQPSSMGTAEHGTAACLGTPPRVVMSSGLPDWDALEVQQQQQPPLQSRISLFHSPQLPGSRSLRRTPQTGINNSPHSQALAMDAAAATCSDNAGLSVQHTAQQQPQQQARQPGDGSKAGSHIPSFKWHQPQLSTTPEKAAGGRAGAMRPPRGRSTSQNGSLQHAAPAICRSASTGGSIGRAAAAAGSLSRLPYGSSAPSSRAVSRANSSRGAVSSSGAIEITRDMLQGSKGALTPEAGLALADYVITPRSAANNNAVNFTNTPTNESAEVVPEHALFAAVEDAIDAAAAAVNKPEVLSPTLSRRFTADGTAGTTGGTLSTAGSFRRQASSLKGRAREACQFDLGRSTSGGGAAAAAGGLDGSSTERSELECIAEQVQQQQLLRDTMSPQQDDLQQQQQAHLQVEQQLAGSSFDADDYQQQLMRCSLNSYSEIVCQGSVDDSVLLSTGATGADSICAVARALGVTADLPVVAPAEAASTLFDSGADAADAYKSCEMDMIGATEVCLHEFYSSAEQEQEDGEQQEAQLRQAQQSSTAAVVSEALTNSSSGHVLGYRPRAASEPGALPFTQQQQQQQKYIKSPVLHSPCVTAHGAAAAAAATLLAASSSAPTLTSGFTGSSKHTALHSMRMHSSPNLLGCSPEQLADMPLTQLGKVLGESGSSNRGRCQASSGSSFLGSLIDSQHSARSSDSGHGVHRSVLAQQQQQQQQQHGSATNGSRLGQRAQGIHSNAVANLVARRAVHSQPLSNAVNGLPGNAAPTAASADDGLNHIAGKYAHIASAAAATASHASAPGMLEAAAVIPLDLNFNCNPNDSQAWEQDDVLLGSPAGSPAASFAQLQLQQASLAAVAAAASRLGAGSSSAGPITMSVIASTLQQEQQQQQQEQLKQPVKGFPEADTECSSPGRMSNLQQQQSAAEHWVHEQQTHPPAAQTSADQRQPDDSLRATVELGDGRSTQADAACGQELCANNDSSYTLNHATVAGSSLLFGSSMASSSFRDSYSPRPSTALTAARVTTTSTAAAALVGTGVGAVCIADRNDSVEVCSVSSSSSSSVVESPRLQSQHSRQQAVQQQQGAVNLCSAADSAVTNTAAVDAAAQELGGMAVQDSYVSVAAADGSHDIVVMGHSMPLEHQQCDLAAAAAAEVAATLDTVQQQQQQHAKGHLAPSHGMHLGTQAAATAAAEQKVLQGRQQQQQQQQQPQGQMYKRETISKSTEQQQQQQQQQVSCRLSQAPVPKQQQHQQEQAAEQQQLQQLLQVSACKCVTSAEGSGSVSSAGNSPVKASSWGGRMLDRIASALKGNSSKQRPGSESGSSSQVSSPAAAQHRRLSSGADVAVGCMPCNKTHHQHQPQQDGQQQQQQQQSGPLAVGAGWEAAAAQAQQPQLGAHLQQQQQHAQDTQHHVTHPSHQQPASGQTCPAAAPAPAQLAVQYHPAGGTNPVRPWEAPTQPPAVLLLRATAVAVSGVGIAAAQGTPEPHLVSCGSTLHAPSLAVVSLLIAVSSFDTDEVAAAAATPAADIANEESAEGQVLAVAAASVAIWAAAQVAAWELEGIDMSALQTQADASGSSIADEPAATTAAADDEAYQAQQQQQQQGRVEQAAGAAAAAAMRIAARPGLPPAAAAAVGAAADELGDSFAIELSGVSSSSSVDLTGLPELLADVSKAQYSRPTSATYNADKYTEPVSPMQLHGSSTGSPSSSGVEQHDEEQQAQQKHNQEQQQQQQQQCGEARHHAASQQQQQQQQQQLRQVPADAAATAVTCAVQSTTTAVSGVADESLTLDSSAVGAASGVRASQAVQTLKQLRSTRRSSIGGAHLDSTAAGAAAAAAVAADSGSGQVYRYQDYQQPQEGQWQQQQQQQRQLPPMCLGHGLSGQPVEVDQQQQQQQDSGASQELSVTGYYQQLLRKQRELEQQRLQQQQQQQQGCLTKVTPSAAAAAGSNSAGCDTSAAAAAAAVQGSTACHNSRSDCASSGHKQLAALAKLKRGTLMRARQLPAPATQAGYQPASNHHAVTASSQGGVQGDTQYAANPIWGSAGGAGSSGGAKTAAAEGADWTNSAVETAPQRRTVWSSGSRADEATEYPSQQHQQQQQFGQLRHRRQQQQQQGAACTSSRTQGSSGQDCNNSEGAIAGAGDRDSVSSSGRDSGGEGCDSAAAAAAAAAKPFLKRKSRAVVGRKLDWSNVQSKTITRLDDRYVPVAKERKATSGPSYDPRVAAAQARAGLMAPGSGAAAGGSRSGRSRTAITSSSYAGYEPGYEMEIRSSTYYRPRGNHGEGKAAGGGASGGGYAAAAPSRVGMSSAPAGSGGGYSALHGRSSSGDDAGGYSYRNRDGTAAAAAAGGAGGGGYASRAGVPTRGAGAAGATPAGVNFNSSKFAAAGLASSGSGLGRRSSSGAGAFGGRAAAAAAAGNGPDPQAPLDDLLNHVNSLIKEFDRMYK